MNDQKVAISLKRFLLIEQCPAEWKGLDLYLFRDEAVVFYVGQSHPASMCRRTANRHHYHILISHQMPDSAAAEVSTG